MKVVHPCEGDLNIRGIKRLYDALDENGAQPLSDVRRLAETQDAFIKTRGVQEDLPHRIVEVAEKE